MTKQLRILTLDDDPLWLMDLEHKLSPYGKVYQARGLEVATHLLENQQIDLAFIDLDLGPNDSGMSLVKKAKDLGVYTVILSAFQDEDIIIEGYEEGADDYISKPLSPSAIEKILVRLKKFKKAHELEQSIFEKFVTNNNALKDDLKKIAYLDQSQRSILIKGESGTGKTHLAHIIHEVLNKRGEAPFISLNCSQLDDNTMNSELFGHKKGSFTGAHQDKKGLIEIANGGTLFLDEVHALTDKAQMRLLKAIDEGVILPLGSNKPVKVDIRLICATCEPIDDLVQRGLFRKDFYYRIRTFTFDLPSLRERPQDILLYIERELSKFERRIVLTQEAKELLLTHLWPGNTREVLDLVENWRISGCGIIRPSDLPFTSPSNQESEYTEEELEKLNSLEQEVEKHAGATGSVHLENLKDMGLKAYLEEIKRNAITQVLEECGGSQIRAAEILGISKGQMSKEVKKYGQASLN